MALEQVVIASIFLAVALGSPVTKDLTSDIIAAGRATADFEFEVNELHSRINSFQSEVNLELVPYANSIRQLLIKLQVYNYDDIDYFFNDAYTNINIDSDNLKSKLESTKDLLLTVNQNLETDLQSLASSTNDLIVSVSEGEIIYADLFTRVRFAVENINVAITFGIGDLEGEDVTRVWVQWTHMKDVMINEEFLTDNVKLVYDYRRQEAFTALDVVIAQVPAEER